MRMTQLYATTLREVPAEAEIVRPQDVSVWIVPGLAFTEDGKRLGYGGGWYDRLLAATAGNALKIGVAHAFQLVDDLPSEQHDILLDRVVSAGLIGGKAHEDSILF